MSSTVSISGTLTGFPISLGDTTRKLLIRFSLLMQIQLMKPSSSMDRRLHPILLDRSSGSDRTLTAEKPINGLMELLSLFRIFIPDILAGDTLKFQCKAFCFDFVLILLLIAYD